MSARHRRIDAVRTQLGQEVPSRPAEACTEIGAEPRPRMGRVGIGERWALHHSSRISAAIGGAIVAVLAILLAVGEWRG